MPLPKGFEDAIYDKHFDLEAWEKYYTSTTAEYKRIKDYTGLSFDEISELPYGAFLLYSKESLINIYMQSEKGKEFLKDIYRYNQTDPDYQSIKDFQKGGV